MENLIILATTKGATIAWFLIFLVVAAVIGFLTSYFYYKSIYMKKIHALEDIIAGLKKDITALETKISELEKKLSQKEALIEELRKKKDEV